MQVRRSLGMFKLRRVKWKIMLPFAVLTALFAVFATRNMTELVTTSLEERLSAQLVSASRRTADDLAKREREQLEVLRAIAFTEGVSEALAASDKAKLGTLVLPQAVNSGAERVEVFDVSGWRLFGVNASGDGGQPVALPAAVVSPEWTVVSEVLRGVRDERGDKWVQVAEADGRTMLVTAGPILDGDGHLVGVVAISTSVEPIVRLAKNDTLADVSLLAVDGRLLGSTFDANDASEENGFLAGRTREGEASGPGEVLGRSYEFLTSPLVLRGEPAGTLSVALPVDSVSATGQSARLRMSVIFGAITVAVIAVGWLIARNLTGPLNRLVFAASAVSNGDLSARSNVRTGDEIGVLGVSFDAMATRLEQQHLATIGALASAIDARDPYTAGHSVRVGDLSAELGLSLGLPKPALHHLRVGGLLHDIGKIGVRDTVLLKPGKLTAKERKQIEQHPAIGLRILESAQLPHEVLEIVGGHHERLNGTGYPLGLGAEELSVFPRITAVADMYDALTTDRPYRLGMSTEEALAILFADADSGLVDPEVVASMQAIARLWEERRRSEGVVSQAWVTSLDTILRNVA
jgi:putative nucleotidyltransferase with HDIG domain